MLIWGRRKQVYFCVEHWTEPMRDLPDGQHNQL
jgi:hypothetical protein